MRTSDASASGASAPRRGGGDVPARVRGVHAALRRRGGALCEIGRPLEVMRGCLGDGPLGTVAHTAIERSPCSRRWRRRRAHPRVILLGLGVLPTARHDGESRRRGENEESEPADGGRTEKRRVATSCK